MAGKKSKDDSPAPQGQAEGQEGADAMPPAGEKAERRPGGLRRCFGRLLCRRKRARKGSEEKPLETAAEAPLEDVQETPAEPVAEGSAVGGSEQAPRVDEAQSNSMQDEDKGFAPGQGEQHRPEESGPDMERAFEGNLSGGDHRGSKIVRVDENGRPGSLFIQKGIMDRQHQPLNELESELGDDSDDEEPAAAAAQGTEDQPSATGAEQSAAAAPPQVQVAEADKDAPMLDAGHESHTPVMEDKLEQIPAPQESQALDVPATHMAPANVAMDDEEPVMVEDTANKEESLLDALKEGPPMDATPEEKTAPVGDENKLATLEDVLKEGPPTAHPEEPDARSGPEEASMAASGPDAARREQQAQSGAAEPTAREETSAPEAQSATPTESHPDLLEQSHVEDAALAAPLPALVHNESMVSDPLKGASAGADTNTDTEEADAPTEASTANPAEPWSAEESQAAEESQLAESSEPQSTHPPEPQAAEPSEPRSAEESQSAESSEPQSTHPPEPQAAEPSKAQSDAMQQPGAEYASMAASKPDAAHDEPPSEAANPSEDMAMAAPAEAHEAAPAELFPAVMHQLDIADAVLAAPMPDVAHNEQVLGGPAEPMAMKDDMAAPDETPSAEPEKAHSEAMQQPSSENTRAAAPMADVVYTDQTLAGASEAAGPSEDAATEAYSSAPVEVQPDAMQQPRIEDVLLAAPMPDLAYNEHILADASKEDTHASSEAVPTASAQPHPDAPQEESHPETTEHQNEEISQEHQTAPDVSNGGEAAAVGAQNAAHEPLPTTDDTTEGQDHGQTAETGNIAETTHDQPAIMEPVVPLVTVPGEAFLDAVEAPVGGAAQAAEAASDPFAVPEPTGTGKDVEEPQATETSGNAGDAESSALAPVATHHTAHDIAPMEENSTEVFPTAQTPKDEVPAEAMSTDQTVPELAAPAESEQHYAEPAGHVEQVSDSTAFALTASAPAASNLMPVDSMSADPTSAEKFDDIIVIPEIADELAGVTKADLALPGEERPPTTNPAEEPSAELEELLEKLDLPAQDTDHGQ